MRDALTIVRELYENFARGDVGAVLAAFAPDIDWNEAESHPYGVKHAGPSAVAEGVFARLGTDWDGFTVKTNEFLPSGDRVVVLGDYAARGRRSGRPFHAQFAHVWTLRDGRVVKFQQYTDTAAWQAELGGSR